MASFACQDCTPEDDYVAVLVCDNINGVSSDFCTYAVQVGTSWSESTNESFAIDASVEAAMSVGFWNLFSAELGTSVATGYDWNHVSEATQGVIKTYKIFTTAPPGYRVVIEQAVGSCGGEKPETELLRTTAFNSTGHLVYAKQEMGDTSLDNWDVIIQLP